MVLCGDNWYDKRQILRNRSKQGYACLSPPLHSCAFSLGRLRACLTCIDEISPHKRVAVLGFSHSGEKTCSSFYTDFSNMKLGTQKYDGYESYPLNSSQEGIGQQGLQYLYSELERRSGSLFVTGTKDCKVGVIELSSTERRGTAPKVRAEPNRAELLTRYLSTLDELEDVLLVLLSSS